MPGRRCKLYDDQLVKSIMVSTGLYILDYLKGNPVVNEQEIYDFIERNADSIIQYTLTEMRQGNEAGDEEAPEGPPENPWEGPGEKE
jgi:hypothetical protein